MDQNSLPTLFPTSSIEVEVNEGRCEGGCNPYRKVWDPAQTPCTPDTETESHDWKWVSICDSYRNIRKVRVMASNQPLN